MPRRAPLLPHSTPEAVVIRLATTADERGLERLSRLDSRRPLGLPALVAERDGRLLAARSLDDDRAVADPFAPTADLAALLGLRAAALRPAAPAASRRRAGLRRRPALARG